MATTAKPAGKPAAAANASPFAALDIEAATKLVEESLPKEAEVSEKFIDGDHWQEGKGWVGPIPSRDDPDYGITLDMIKTAFTSRNVIKEITQRHMRGVVGMEPIIGVAPRVALPPGETADDNQIAAQREIEAALTEWWDCRAAHVILQRAVANSCWAERGPLRLFIPRGKIQGGSLPTGIQDLATALSFVYLEAPSPMNAAVAVDADTQDHCGILITEIDGKKQVEMSFLEPSTTPVPDPKNPRQTVIRAMNDDGSEEFPFPIGGRILMYSVERSLLVTEQIQEMQRSLNLALSMIPRTVVTAGFLERMILNALPPGHWETDSKGQRTKFVRDTWQTGPGTTNWVRGLELPQKDGSVALTTPSVAFREPSDTAPISAAKRDLYRDMLEEADQAHVLMTSEATPSGNSRREGRTDFAASLTETEAPTNAAGRWLIETVLALAELLMAKPGSILDNWRGQFECRVNAGQVSPEESQQIINVHAAGLYSDETAMDQLGILDVQAERDRITAQSGGVDLGLIKRQGETALVWTQAGAFVEAAAELVGLSDEQIKIVTPTTTDPNGNPGTDPNGNPLPTDGNTNPGDGNTNPAGE